MDACIVENNIIVNVVVLPDGADPAAFGCKLLPPCKWIGDEYDSDATQAQRIAELEAENKTLKAENKTIKAQVSAQSEQMDFYEECIAEMASVVYA